MKTIITFSLNNFQKQQIIDIWNSVYPSLITLSSLEDFNRYLDSLENQKHILLQNLDEEIIG